MIIFGNFSLSIWEFFLYAPLRTPTKNDLWEVLRFFLVIFEKKFTQILDNLKKNFLEVLRSILRIIPYAPICTPSQNDFGMLLSPPWCFPYIYYAARYRKTALKGFLSGVHTLVGYLL